jgi:hypothetical protein
LTASEIAAIEAANGIAMEKAKKEAHDRHEREMTQQAALAKEQLQLLQHGMKQQGQSFSL